MTKPKSAVTQLIERYKHNSLVQPSEEDLIELEHIIGKMELVSVSDEDEEKIKQAKIYVKKQRNTPALLSGVGTIVPPPTEKEMRDWCFLIESRMNAATAREDLLLKTLTPKDKANYLEEQKNQKPVVTTFHKNGTITHSL